MFTANFNAYRARQTSARRNRGYRNAALVQEVAEFLENRPAARGIYGEDERAVILTALQATVYEFPAIGNASRIAQGLADAGGESLTEREVAGIAQVLVRGRR